METPSFELKKGDVIEDVDVVRVTKRGVYISLENGKYFLSKTFLILQNSNVVHKIYRIKMLPSVKYDGTPKHDKMCSKLHSQSMGP